MIIKEITIKNFRSYYGENKFVFSDGLTLIVGDNGDGKTTFFDALQWLFNNTPDEKPKIDNVSEMCKSELEIGECNEVSVSMLFDHDGEKFVEKKFSFERTDETNYKAYDFSFRGYENNKSEREVVSGKNLMDRCFDAFIQRFSMFKGESTLNVFDNRAALKELVDKFSDVRKFDELVSLSSEMEKDANDAWLKECRSDKKIATEAKDLEIQLKNVTEKINNIKKEIAEKQVSIDTYSSRLDELEKNQENSEKYKEMSDRLKNLNEKASRLKGQISAVNKSYALLDKYWILCAFPDILNSFKSKISSFSKEKRKQDEDFIKQRSEQIGKIKAIDEICGTLEGGATMLPWYLPNQETMEEMIHDHVCKVCGRPAPEGSEAFNFMMSKLNDYKKHIAEEAKSKREIESLEKKKLFSGKYTEEIHTLSIRLSGNEEAKIAGIKDEIKDRLNLEEKLKSDLKELEDKIQETKDDIARLLIQAGNVSEDILLKDFTDIRGIFDQKERAAKRLAALESELESEEEKKVRLKEKFNALNPQSSQVKNYQEVHRAFEEIAKAFSNAKNENLRRFLGALEDCANKYLNKLSANDFHGEIHLHQTADDSTEIKLVSSNGSEVKNPSGSQKTVMYMSVLFAISDFSDIKRDENYPLIFDAATSSFGDSKEEEFYNVIDKLQKQCIIVTKDFITKGQLRIDEVDKLSCSVYRIKKAANFDERNMATIRTQVEKIK